VTDGHVLPLVWHRSRRERTSHLAGRLGMIVADLFARPDYSIGQTLKIAGDELTGQRARYEEQPIEEGQASTRISLTCWPGRMTTLLGRISQDSERPTRISPPLKHSFIIIAWLLWHNT
jgi:hypothetical protein